jgi:hypothetical protein
VLIVVGILLMGVIVPGMKQWPNDVHTIRNYDGTMPVLLNASNFEFMTDLAVQIKREVKTEATDGGVALVSEDITMSSGEQALQHKLAQYAIDRKTMECTSNYPDGWKGKDGFWDRQGLVLGWPIDSEKRDYTGWSDDYRATVTLSFVGEEKHDRSGLTTYHYHAESPPVAIDPAQVAVMGLPLELPKPQLIGLIETTSLPALIKSQLPTLLERWPEDNVPLAYYYEYQGDYWAEPDTGVLIDTAKHELRKVGLPEELIANSPLANLSEEQRASLRVPVFDLTYQASDESVQDAKKDAEDAKRQIALFGRTLPIAGIVVGLVLVVLGGFFATRKAAQ